VTAAEGPFYNSETTDTHGPCFAIFIAPWVLGKSIQVASEVMRLLEPVRATKWPRRLSKLLFGMSKRGKKGFRCDNYSVARGRRLPAEFHWESDGTRRSSLPRLKKELNHGYQRVKSKLNPARTSILSPQVRKHFPED